MAEGRDDQGFTLIELLVVMIVIGLLAAIAVPVFRSSRGKARDASTRSDTARLGKAVISHFVDGTTPPAVTTSDGQWFVGGASVGAVSPGVRIVTTFTGTAVNSAVAPAFTTTAWTQNGWCLALTHDDGRQKTYRYSDQKGLETGQCASATSPG